MTAPLFDDSPHMSRVILLQHSDTFGPGRIIPLLNDFGIPTEVRRLHHGDEVPTDLDEVRALILLGGSLSVHDAGKDGFGFMTAEIELLKKMVQHDRRVLGIGFGAQLLAFAAGAKVSINGKPGATPEDPITPVPEFGWGPLSFPFPGGTEPMVMGLMDGAPMFHWHTETFDLPRFPPPPNPAPPPAPPPPTGNALLCSSRPCRNQGFRFKSGLFGFQFHFEQSEAGIDKILSSDPFAATVGSDGIAKIRAETPKVFNRYARLGDKLINNWVQFLKQYQEHEPHGFSHG